MSQTCSPSTQRRYGLARVCRVWELARSTVYLEQVRRAGGVAPAQKRGPKTRWSDGELVDAIRAVLGAVPFLGEGHRKVWARLRWQGVRTSKARVLRLMREAQLLAPTRAGHAHGPKAHDGTIKTEQPDQMWGMDATSCLTRREGTATVFVVVDHCASECIGIHAAKPGTRFEAIEPLRQGIQALFGEYEAGIAAGLLARHDHGNQYVSDYVQDELKFLGITSSPAFVREPEGNGVAERFIRTLKEQLLWVRTFDTVEELRLALLEFKERYNRQWLGARPRRRRPAA
jgi:putative transposase